MAKQNRVTFTVGSKTNDDVKAIENYYEKPVSALFLDNVIELIKQKAATVPPSYRKAIN